MPTLGKYIALLALFLCGAVAARAHDAMQASTNVWLRPDKMEVEIIMSRAPVRLLPNPALTAPVTEDNFEEAYHTLLKKYAPEMLEVTVDGKPLQPSSVEVALFEETDVQFSFVYPRPPNGRLRFTANFLKRLGDGYGNSLGMNEDRKVLGYGDQSTDNLAWEINLGKDAGIPSPSELSHPPEPTPPVATAAPTPKTPAPAKTAPQDTYFIIPHFNLWTLVGLGAVIILLAIWRIRQKSGS